MTAPLILRGDARALPLPDSSVDLIVTSPPYFGLRSYTDSGEHYAGQIGSESTPTEFIAALIECTREMVRVLKPTGSIFLNLGDKYSGAQAQNFGGASRAGTSAKVWAQTDPKRTGIPNKSLMLIPERYRIACTDELGLIARAVIVWSKPNGLPESVTDRVRRSHEDWVHLTRRPRYYSAVDEIREAHLHGGHGSTWRERVDGVGIFGEQYRTTRGSRSSDPVSGDTAKAGNPLGKLPGSVWEIATQPLHVPAHLGVDHFAAFPMEWPRRLILGWSPREVCTGCGEGRRPVADRRTVDAGSARFRPTLGHVSATGVQDRREGARRAMVSAITGYACACPDTSAPARPGVVLDPFGGTGTTALVAAMHGRTGISVDLSGDYCRLARWRASDPKERARAAGLDPDAVARVERPHERQDPLPFDTGAA